MPIYLAYKEPPEPPEDLWLEIDLDNISFKTERDIEYVENVIIRYNPELYATINLLYKINSKNLRNNLKISKENSPPKIMKKIRKR